MDISIITATLNTAGTIADCFQSIAAQTHPCEHIIIDGASTDNTLEVISRLIAHTSYHTRVFSEPDKGIYDAMNKGIAMANGEVIGILNADDLYASPYVLERVAAVFADPNVDACYGDLEYVVEAGSRVKGQGSRDTEFRVIRYWKSGEYKPDSFYQGWMPPHPTFFVRRSAYERYGTFRLDIGSAADYELMLRLLLKHNLRADYIPEVLVRMRVGGASNVSLKARLSANRMDRRAWEVNGLKPYPWTLMFKPLRKIGQFLRKN